MSDLTKIHEPTQDPSPSVTLPDLGNPDNVPTQHAAGDAPRTPTYVVAVGQRFGEYEILTEIARGGMGVVYRARQEALDRIVALKMILAGRLANPEDVHRFRTEAGAAAKLQHPNIVAVHDVGDHEGQHYFTMEYIEGISLDQRLAQGPLTSKAAARYVRILARAVHYAHKQGILHRDLKPSNILIDRDDEPHITDFGLAKRLGDPESGKTRTGAVLGTPSYMSPEQAQGHTEQIGPPSDTYSLGAILYELITGRPPFRAETPLDTVMQVIDDTAVPPRLLNAQIDHDLETICMKCLEKNPQLRYASAEELGEDLQRYLDGDSIHARSFTVIDRLAHVLDRDAHTADFSTWSSMVLVLAGVVFAEHFAVFLLIQAGQPAWLLLAARILLFVTLGFLFWRHRGQRLLPTSAAERELWTIWIGYFTAYFFIVIITRMLMFYDILRANPDWIGERYFRDLLPYPFLALVSGLAFFIMGANYWGRCYAIGLTFFVAAALMPVELTYAPLLFGILWGIVLATLGRHLRKQGAAQQHTPPLSLSEAATVQYQERNMKPPDQRDS